jgi:uncharacterized membrane protein YeaQ/YmgE (transglycosylase-associated protein family)
MWWLIRTIFVGFVVGVIAKFVTPGSDKYEPKGFLLTTALGIAGAFAATLIGQWIGHYGPEDNAGWIASTLGAVGILLIWGWFQRQRQP